MTTLRHFSHPDILPNWQYWCIPTNWANIPFTNAIFVAFSRFCSLSSNSSCWVTRNKSHQTSSCETIRFSRDLPVTLPFSTRQPEALKAAVNPARKLLFVRRAMCIQARAWKGRRQNTSGDTGISTWLVSTAGTLGEANHCHWLILMFRCSRSQRIETSSTFIDTVTGLVKTMKEWNEKRRSY